MFESILFYSLAGILVVSSLLVITRINPIASALSLVLGFVALAGLYAMLSAGFAAVIQILVYAGGIMVLILFVIMILNMSMEELLPLRPNRIVVALVLLIVMGGAWMPLAVFISSGMSGAAHPVVDGFGGIVEMSKLIFGRFLFPFEMLSLILLTALVGAVVLAKRKL